MRFKLLITIMTILLWSIETQSTSKYEAVSWNEKVTLWRDEFYFNGKQSKYYFGNERDPTKTRNWVHKKMGVFSQNPVINKIPNRRPKVQGSQFKGVFWIENNNKWCVKIITLKGKQQKYGGVFNDELDAAKRANQLCEEMEIPHKNPGISAIPNQLWHRKEKSSQYNGVFWNTDDGHWCAVLYLHGKNKKRCGFFNDELDAAKSVNQLCEKMGIPYKNPGIGAVPNRQWQPKQMTSQYNGVNWNKQRHKWSVQLRLQGGKRKFGGYFKDELDAAKKVNQLCEEIGIRYKNHGIGTMINQQQNGHNTIDSSEGTNFIISSEINQAEDNCNYVNKNKRKRENDIIMNENISFEKYYFHENFLK